MACFLFSMQSSYSSWLIEIQSSRILKKRISEVCLGWVSCLMMLSKVESFSQNSQYFTRVRPTLNRKSSPSRRKLSQIRARKLSPKQWEKTERNQFTKQTRVFTSRALKCMLTQGMFFQRRYSKNWILNQISFMSPWKKGRKWYLCMVFMKQLKASYLLRQREKTSEIQRRLRTRLMSGRITAKSSTSSTDSKEQGSFQISGRCLFFFLYISQRDEVRPRLFPITTGHRVFLLDSGSPNFQRVLSSEEFEKNPESSCMVYTFSFVDPQQNPFSTLCTISYFNALGLFSLQSQCSSQCVNISVFHFSSIFSLLKCSLNSPSSFLFLFSLFWIRRAPMQFTHFDRVSVSLALRSRLLLVVMMEKHMESNWEGTLLYFITWVEHPRTKSVMSYVLMCRYLSSLLLASTHLISFQSQETQTFLCTDLILFTQNLMNTCPFISSITLLRTLESPEIVTFRLSMCNRLQISSTQ